MKRVKEIFNIVHCLFVKVMSFMIMGIGIGMNFVFLPRSLFFLIIGIPLFLVGYKILLSTNNPLHRKNTFTIDKHFSGRMNGSVRDNGLTAINLREPTLKEFRKEKLKKLNK